MLYFGNNQNQMPLKNFVVSLVAGHRIFLMILMLRIVLRQIRLAICTVIQSLSFKLKVYSQKKGPDWAPFRLGDVLIWVYATSFDLVKVFKKPAL